MGELFHAGWPVLDEDKAVSALIFDDGWPRLLEHCADRFGVLPDKLRWQLVLGEPPQLWVSFVLSGIEIADVTPQRHCVFCDQPVADAVASGVAGRTTVVAIRREHRQHGCFGSPGEA